VSGSCTTASALRYRTAFETVKRGRKNKSNAATKQIKRGSRASQTRPQKQINRDREANAPTLFTARVVQNYNAYQLFAVRLWRRKATQRNHQRNSRTS
jgi:hypothetical protein